MTRISIRLLILTGWLGAGLLLAPVGVAAQRDELCRGPFMPVSPPLTELGEALYRRVNEQGTAVPGGLYPDGRNERPPAHEAAGQAIAAAVTPLDAEGSPDPANGKIVLISVGMSNTSSEFNTFIQMLHGDTAVNPQVVIVNGAQGGRTADRWADPETDTWDNLNAALHHRRVTPAQVQAAWIKLTLTRGGDFPEKAEALQANLETIVQELKQRYPNLKLIYLSSRTRSYTYERGLSPEPVAFETGFAVKWLIEKQINGDPGLNFDPAQGEVRAPYLSWGPYLWIDGQNPRADGRVWLAEDMIGDCTHPSTSGNQKVAQMLRDFFLTDSTTAWFRAGAHVSLATPTVTNTAVPTHTPAPTATPTAAATETSPPTPAPTATNTAVATQIALTTTVPTSPTPSPLPAVRPGGGEAGTAVWPAALGAGLLAGLMGLGLGWWLRGRRA